MHWHLFDKLDLWLLFDDHKADEDLLHFVELKDQKCEIFYDKLKFIYIELPKFRKTEEISQIEPYSAEALFTCTVTRLVISP